MRSLVLKITVGFVLLNAAAGIFALLAGGSGGIGESETRILLTTLTISVAGFILLPCVIAVEAGSLGSPPVLPALAGLTSIVGFGMLIVGIWTEPADDDAWRMTASVIVVGAAGSFACLLSLARSRSIAWLRTLAYALVLLLATELLVGIWGHIDSDSAFWRAIGVTAILLLAASLLLPVMQRGGGRTAEALLDAVAYCPRCGAAIDAAESTARCPRCDARFRVEYLPS
jgi:hypothetical protein